MIHATTNSSFHAYIQTQDVRIGTANDDNTRYLFKFTNDMSGVVQYAYPEQTLYNRYSKFSFTYNATPDVFLGRVDLKPSGYWKYEVYEVTWGILLGLDSETAPSTELAVFSPADTRKGVVQGLVTKGKLLVSEQRGTEEVQYTQNGGEVISLDLAYSGVGYSSAPTLTFIGACITPATATCTVSGGVVDTVTLTFAGNGYSENPSIILSSVGETAQASITASIQENNYIYTG